MIRAVRIVLTLFATLVLFASPIRAQEAERTAVAAAIARGSDAAQKGDIAGATSAWEEAIRRARAINDGNLAVEALVRRGEAYRMIGYLDDAETDLEAAVVLATQTGNHRLIAAAEGALGGLELVERHFDKAEKHLTQSRDFARTANDPNALAASSNDLGSLYAESDRAPEAVQAYRLAVASAAAGGSIELAATAEINGARLAWRQGSVVVAIGQLRSAVARLAPLAPRYDRGLILVSAGAVILDHAPALTGDQKGLAERAFSAAATMAKAIHNPQLASLADGNLGKLYQMLGRSRQADAATDRAVFAAQNSPIPDLAYRWDWQQARIAKQGGRIDDAIASYRRAVDALETVRKDIPVEYRDGRSSYRVTFGPLYLEFADLLLQRARSNPSAAPSLLREARNTIETLKESEMQDYFRDSCVADFEARNKAIDTIAPGAAVLYPISLSDRMELLVSFGNELRQFTIPVPASTLRREVQQFRALLKKRTTNEYLAPSRTLYDQVIRPIDSLLQAQHIDTLVVVPDDVFRIIPFAALNDGNHFLIDRYATAIAPSLHLVAPEPLGAESPVALVLGVSQSVQGYVGLPNVPRELSAVHQIEGGEMLLNSSFTRARFAAALKQTPFNIVHIASHGRFGPQPNETYLLAYDGTVTMDELEADIKYGEHRLNPIELLVLSACETASGDDRSALGLAGIALKAGARSALASLWYVSDEASESLVTEFYRALKEPGISKARALQTAQRHLAASMRYAHPAYWAPVLLIGNWL